jgi:hypothetical protein
MNDGLSQADLKPTTVAEMIAMLKKFRTTIYSNLDSNSKIFDNMYRFLFHNIALVNACPDELDPMTHYWCNKNAHQRLKVHAPPCCFVKILGEKFSCFFIFF